ncbi:unnamed protein product, partial [Symbiodinium necroappetens]
MQADSAPSVLELGRAVAVAASRGIEVKPGLRALIPVLDLIGPPEATTCAGEDTPEPSCHIAVEPSGGPGGRAIAIVTAARDLRAGECLSRDVDASADSLLLDWGLASTRRRDDVALHVGIKKGVAQSWQVSTLRELLDLRPGDDGGWVASAKVRRSSSLRKALDPKLWVAARILGCSSKAEALGADWDVRSREDMLRAGLDGVSAAHRRRALWVLKQAVQSALDNFETTAPDDEEVIRLTEDERQRVAASYRMAKRSRQSKRSKTLCIAWPLSARLNQCYMTEVWMATGLSKAMVLFVLSDPRLPFGSAFDSTNPWLRSAYAALGPGNRVTCLYIGAGSSMRSQALLAAEEEALPTVLCNAATAIEVWLSEADLGLVMRFVNRPEVYEMPPGWPYTHQVLKDGPKKALEPADEAAEVEHTNGASSDEGAALVPQSLIGASPGEYVLFDLNRDNVADIPDVTVELLSPASAL